MTIALGAVAVGTCVVAIGLLPLGLAGRVGTIRHPDRLALADAGWRHGLARWEAVRGASIAVGIVLTGAVGLFPLVGLAGGLVPSIGIRLRAELARDRARSAATQLLVSAHAMLRSGVALPEALRRAAAGCDDILARRPFALALARFDLGDPLDASIRDAANVASDHRTVAMLHTLALGITERLPIERAASLVEAVVDRAVHDERLDAEVRARSAGARAQSYLLAAIVPGLALYLVATMPGLGATLASPLGRVVLLPLATALEVGGIFVGRRIVRGSLR